MRSGSSDEFSACLGNGPAHWSDVGSKTLSTFQAAQYRIPIPLKLREWVQTYAIARGQAAMTPSS